MIMHSSRPSAADVSAALAAGFAVEMRPDGTARYISSGEHVIELDALGDRLPIEGGARHRAQQPAAGLPPIHWPPADIYQEQP